MPALCAPGGGVGGSEIVISRASSFTYERLLGGNIHPVASATARVWACVLQALLSRICHQSSMDVNLLFGSTCLAMQFSVACFASLWHFVFNGAFVASYKLSLVAIIMSTQEHKMCCHCIPSICKPGLSETLTLQSTVWLEATVERCTTAFWQWPRKVIWSDWDSLPGNISTTFSSVQALFSYVEKGCDAGASINKCTQDWTAFESAIHQRLPVGQLSFDVLLRDYLHVRYQHQWCY